MLVGGIQNGLEYNKLGGDAALVVLAGEELSACFEEDRDGLSEAGGVCAAGGPSNGFFE